jgi:hypothetical protein
VRSAIAEPRIRNCGDLHWKSLQTRIRAPSSYVNGFCFVKSRLRPDGLVDVHSAVGLLPDANTGSCYTYRICSTLLACNFDMVYIGTCKSDSEGRSVLFRSASFAQ